MAACLVLNTSRKSSQPTDNQAMALVKLGGMEPLYSGAQIKNALAFEEELGERAQGRGHALCLGLGRVERQVELCQVKELGALDGRSRQGREVLCQFEVLAVAGSDDEKHWGGMPGWGKDQGTKGAQSRGASG